MLVGPASGRLEFSDEENEIRAWLRTATPSLHVLERLDRAIIADETLMRSLLIARCREAESRRGADRWLNAAYGSVLAEAVRTVDRIASEDAQAHGALASDWEAALIHTWRAWRRPRQLEWLQYMRSAEARRGIAWWATMRTLEDLEILAIDIQTGAVIPAWIDWLDGFLRGAALETAFERAANAAEAGLGEAYKAVLSRPGETIPPDRSVARDAVAGRLTARWSEIIKAMDRFVDPETLQAGRSWSSHPFFHDINARFEEVIDLTYGSATPSTDLAGFLIQAGRGKPRMDRLREAALAALLAEVDRNCAALR